jgi:aconitate hydratase 2/2-methylisocitrate dehydratase
MFEEYKKHVAERAENGIPAKPLTAQQVRELIALLENKRCEDREALINLLINQVSPGVDAAAKVKAEFLDKIIKAKTSEFGITPQDAITILGTMQGATIFSRSLIRWTIVNWLS